MDWEEEKAKLVKHLKENEKIGLGDPFIVDGITYEVQQYGSLFDLQQVKSVKQF